MSALKCYQFVFSSNAIYFALLFKAAELPDTYRLSSMF